MKVRLLTSEAGDGFSRTAGDIIDVSPAEAKSRIEKGQAEAIAEKPVKRAQTRAKK